MANAKLCMTVVPNTFGWKQPRCLQNNRLTNKRKYVNEESELGITKFKRLNLLIEHTYPPRSILFFFCLKYY